MDDSGFSWFGDKDSDPDPFELIDDTARKVAEEHQRKLENAIKDAILDGADGLDLCYTWFLGSPISADAYSWKYDENGDPPEPRCDGRTVRYEWRWFDKGELQRAIIEGTFDSLIEEVEP